MRLLANSAKVIARIYRITRPHSIVCILERAQAVVSDADLDIDKQLRRPSLPKYAEHYWVFFIKPFALKDRDQAADGGASCGHSPRTRAACCDLTKTAKSQVDEAKAAVRAKLMLC